MSVQSSAGQLCLGCAMEYPGTAPGTFFHVPGKTGENERVEIQRRVNVLKVWSLSA